MLRRLKKDVLKELPEKTYQLISIPAPNAKVADYATKSFTWGKQEASKKVDGAGGEYIAIIRHQLALAKVAQACAHIEDLLLENDKLVVFAYHRDVIEEIANRLKHYGYVVVTGSNSTEERQESVNLFQKDPGTRLFIGQFQAAGDGITLTAANTVVFVECSWTPAEIEQAADRVHRIGQRKAVLIQFLVIEKSYEEYMLRTAIDKRQVIVEIVDGAS